MMLIGEGIMKFELSKYNRNTPDEELLNHSR